MPHQEIIIRRTAEIAVKITKTPLEATRDAVIGYIFVIVESSV